MNANCSLFLINNNGTRNIEKTIVHYITNEGTRFNSCDNRDLPNSIQLCIDHRISQIMFSRIKMEYYISCTKQQIIYIFKVFYQRPLKETNL